MVRTLQLSLQHLQPGTIPNAYTSGSANVSPFTNKSKRFNDWSISAGAGTVIMKSGSLYSLHDESGAKIYSAGQLILV